MNGTVREDVPLGHMPKKIGVIYSDVKREYFPTEAQFLTEKDALHDAEVVAQYIRKLDIEAILFPANADLPLALSQNRPDMVFNLVGSVRGNEYLASTIPALFELLEIPYTGTGVLGESLAYNKFLVKKLLQQAGVPVPACQLFTTPNDPIDPTLRFPLISKLNEIHGAVEITRENAISENEKHLRDRIKFLISTYDQPVLVEEFIAGREITAILLHGLHTKVYLAEKVFHPKEEQKYLFATFEDQWNDHGGDSITYQKFDDPVLKAYVRKAFDMTKMSDYAKFDVRLDSSGRYFFVDANSNPAFGPKELEMAIGYILDLHDISFSEILKRLIQNTVRDVAAKELESAKVASD